MKEQLGGWVAGSVGCRSEKPQQLAGWQRGYVSLQTLHVVKGDFVAAGGVGRQYLGDAIGAIGFRPLEADLVRKVLGDHPLVGGNDKTALGIELMGKGLQGHPASP